MGLAKDGAGSPFCLRSLPGLASETWSKQIQWLTRSSPFYPFRNVLVVLAGVVLIGGIKRLGAIAGKLVPFMAIAYIAAGTAVLIVNSDKIPKAFDLIFSHAFSPMAGHRRFRRRCGMGGYRRDKIPWHRWLLFGEVTSR
jgi:hypothetical protein